VSRAEQAERYRQANIECASIILADTSRFPGLMQEWAKAVLEEHEAEQRVWSLIA
jgi:hypothetical protein